jgi:hypothetical protein
MGCVGWGCRGTEVFAFKRCHDKRFEALEIEERVCAYMSVCVGKKNERGGVRVPSLLPSGEGRGAVRKQHPWLTPLWLLHWLCCALGMYLWAP